MSRRPPRRKLLPYSRPMFDGKHPGPVSFQIKPTHVALDHPFEFQMAKEKEAKSHIEDPNTEVMLYFRCSAGADMTSLQPGDTVRIKAKKTSVYTVCVIRKWFQPDRYRSGYCIVSPASDSTPAATEPEAATETIDSSLELS